MDIDKYKIHYGHNILQYHWIKNKKKKKCNERQKKWNKTNEASEDLTDKQTFNNNLRKLRKKYNQIQKTVASKLKITFQLRNL